MSALESSQKSKPKKNWNVNIKFPVFWTSFLIILSIITYSFITGKFGLIGEDSDDALRLVQIRDYLAGQSWFHTDQYRLGLAGGTDMHWSRLPDIPIILLTHIFDLFMSQEQALRIAISIWPPISAAILIAGLVTGAKFWGEKTIKLFTMILLAFFVAMYFRFSAGNIDHHNVQMGFIALSMGCALDPKIRFQSYFLSGLALAISIAIGAEIYIFAAVICAFIAINWAIKGHGSVRGTQGFGLGLSTGLIGSFVATIAPSEYNLIYCDALSLITIIAGVTGGLGLAVLALLTLRTQLFETWPRRTIGLGGLGIICAALLSFQAPQCLANPLDILPEDVLALWLGGITEAQTIFGLSENRLTLIPFMIGPPIAALSVMFWRLSQDRKSGEPLWSPKILVLLLLGAALALTVYQIRFYPFAYIFAILPLAGWTANAFTEGKKDNEGSVAYLACLAASIPFIWGAPGILLNKIGGSGPQTAQVERLSAQDCASEAVLKAFGDLPRGLIMSNANMAGSFLMDTEHRVMSGNYHRNWKGIATQIQIAISEPKKAYDLLADNQADYVHYCDMGEETPQFIRQNDQGLYAQLHKGLVPDYLKPVFTQGTIGQQVQIFRFHPAANLGGQ